MVWKTDSLASFKEAAALADRHYRLGAVEMPLYIELQEKYLEAMEAINETKSAALEAALTLEQLTGQPDTFWPNPASLPPPSSDVQTNSKK